MAAGSAPSSALFYWTSSASAAKVSGTCAGTQRATESQQARWVWNRDCYSDMRLDTCRNFVKNA